MESAWRVRALFDRWLLTCPAAVEGISTQQQRRRVPFGRGDGVKEGERYAGTTSEELLGQSSVRHPKQPVLLLLLLLLRRRRRRRT